MIPKEKAKEIINKLIFIPNGEKFQIISMEDEKRAIKSALIAIDIALEFINNREAFNKNIYLLEVKNEIKKLNN